MTEATDPFMPTVPKRYDPGRVTTHGVILAGWPCRICLLLLTATPSGGVLCTDCDTNTENSDDA
jgi:hypothetical protein